MTSLFRCVAAMPLLLLGLSGIALAQAPAPHVPMPAEAAGRVTVQNAWARASAGQAGTSVVYLTVVAATGAADRLVGARTPVAAMAELHETVMDGHVMQMRPVAGIDVAPGKPAELKPGGAHIMLMGLARPLRAGESFPLTLNFASAPPVTVTVNVVPPGGSAPHAH